jgi:predicted aspartyl protease
MLPAPQEVIHGIVTDDDEPMVELAIGGRVWDALVDSGFNGDLELPDALRPHVNPRWKGPAHSRLAGGTQVVDACFEVDVPFGARLVQAVAIFVPGEEITIGTRILRDWRLTIDFAARTVLLERVR